MLLAIFWLLLSAVIWLQSLDNVTAGDTVGSRQSINGRHNFWQTLIIKRNIRCIIIGILCRYFLFGNKLLTMPNTRHSRDDCQRSHASWCVTSLSHVIELLSELYYNREVPAQLDGTRLLNTCYVTQNALPPTHIQDKSTAVIKHHDWQSVRIKDTLVATPSRCSVPPLAASRSSATFVSYL